MDWYLIDDLIVAKSFMDFLRGLLQSWMIRMPPSGLGIAPRALTMNGLTGEMTYRPSRISSLICCSTRLRDRRADL